MKIGTNEEIQGQTTQFRLTDFSHFQTLPVLPGDLPISKVWKRSDNNCYGCNTLKMGKIEEIQGQITKFRFTNFAHIRTWPVFHMVLPISKPNSGWPILLIFKHDLWFIGTFLFPKFEADRIIFVLELLLQHLENWNKSARAATIYAATNI